MDAVAETLLEKLRARLTAQADAYGLELLDGAVERLRGQEARAWRK